MKTPIVALITLALSAPALAAENGFSCESHWYREAELTVNTGTITVKDTYMRGLREVAEIVEEKMQLGSGNYTVRTIALSVNREAGLDCESSGLLVKCEGRADKAWLQVGGWVTSNGMNGELNLSIPVELKDLRLQTHFGSDGSHQASGGQTAAIGLKYLNLAANAKVVLHDQEVELVWSTFFHPRDDRKSGSFCTIY